MMDTVNGHCVLFCLGQIFSHQSTESIDHHSLWCISFCKLQVYNEETLRNLLMFYLYSEICMLFSSETNEWIQKLRPCGGAPQDRKTLSCKGNCIELTYSFFHLVLFIFFTFLMKTNSCDIKVSVYFHLSVSGSLHDFWCGHYLHCSGWKTALPF